MKRRLLIIAVFLLLGAVVNVAVAWGCALWINIGRIPADYGRTAVEQRNELIALCRCIGSTQRLGAKRVSSHYEVGITPGPGELSAEAILPDWYVTSPGTPNPGPLSITDARGFPLLSLWSSYTFDDWWLRRLVEMTGIQLSATNPGQLSTKYPGIYTNWEEWPTALPIRPIWPGFAINTIFYATIVWVLLLGPFVLRRFLRVRRGLCPKCAYPMGESSVCTECGGALAKHHVA